MKICSNCQIEPAVNSSKCRECYNFYMKEYQKLRYKKRRDEAIASLGGKCAHCSSVNNLELDHIDASTKTYEIGKIIGGGSKAKVEAELAKCQVLCKDCHITKSYAEGDIYSVDHGGGTSGKKNCPCTLCKNKKAEYMKARKTKYKESARLKHFNNI